MDDIPKIIAALAFFGAMVVCPLVYMLIKHQRAMAEIVNRNSSLETLQRMAALEREVHELRAARLEQVLKDDDNRELERRIT